MKKIIINYFYNSSFKILEVIIPLITTPYLSRTLGVDSIGIFEYTFTIIGYFSLIIGLGINTYGQREIAYHRDDIDYTSKLTEQLLFIRSCLFAATLSVYIIFSIAYKKYTIYLLIFSPILIAQAIDVSWIYQGNEDFKHTLKMNIISKVVQTVCIFKFVRSKEDLIKYIVICVICTILSQSLMWIGVKKYVRLDTLEIKGIKQHIVSSLVLFEPQILTTFYTMADKVMLGTLTTSAQVALYAQSEKIIKMAMMIPVSLGAVVMPAVAHQLADKNNQKNVIQILENTSMWSWFSGLPIIAGIIGISKGFSLWFFGAGFEDTADLMTIISPIVIIIGLSDVYGMQYLIPANHMRGYTISVFMGALLNVILNLLSIKVLGALGASIATVLSELLVMLTMRTFVRKYITFRAYPSAAIVVSAVIMGIIVKTIDLFMPVSLLTTCAEIIVGIITYFGLLVVFKDKFMRKIIDKIFGKDS